MLVKFLTVHLCRTAINSTPLSTKHNLHQTDEASVTSHSDCFLVLWMPYNIYSSKAWSSIYSKSSLSNRKCSLKYSSSRVKRVLHYIKGAIHFRIRIMRESTFNLYGFSDADWAQWPNTRWSTSGYHMFLGSNNISWSAKRQRAVSRSSTAARIILWPSQHKKSLGSHFFLGTLGFLDLPLTLW